MSESDSDSETLGRIVDSAGSHQEQTATTTSSRTPTQSPSSNLNGVTRTPQAFRARKGGAARTSLTKLDVATISHQHTTLTPQSSAPSLNTSSIVFTPHPPPDSPERSPESPFAASAKEASRMEQELSNMLLPPSALHVVHEVKERNEDGESEDETKEEAQGVLIPREIPPSRILYVLTTSEGRDKIMKTITYIAKLSICVLKARSLIPQAATETLNGWALSLASVVQKVREGRALFKIGRWLITVFHIEIALSLLISKLFPILALRARIRAAKDGQEISRRASILQLAKECYYTLTKKKSFLDDFEFSEEMKRKAGEQYDNFTLLQMLIMTIRCFASAIRNILRDKLFIQSQRLFGAPPMNPSIRLKLQTTENIVWHLVSCIDFVMNMYRLLDRGWWHNASDPDAVIECKCTKESMEKRDSKRSEYAANSFINKKETCFFPAADVDLGCPAPTAPLFFDAVKPNLLPLLCRQCHSVCVAKLTPHSSLTQAPDLVTAITTKVSSSTATPNPAPNHSSSGGTSPLPPGAPVIMGLPSALRRMTAIWWCLTEHHNLGNTVLLQLKYAFDVYLSFRYVFGDLAKGRSTYASVAGIDPLKQHLHTTANIAGLFSAAVSLQRVYLSSSK